MPVIRPQKGPTPHRLHTGLSCLTRLLLGVVGGTGRCVAGGGGGPLCDPSHDPRFHDYGHHCPSRR